MDDPARLTEAVRPAQEPDLPSIVRIHQQVLSYSLNSQLGADHLLHVYRVMSHDPDSLVSCVILDGEVAGVVSATADPEALTARLRASLSPARWVAMLSKIALHPGWWHLVWESMQVAAPAHWHNTVVRPCLTTIAVNPEFQRKGIGRMLVTAVDNFMQSRGYLAYRLDTLAENATADAFYRQLGFEAVERRGPAVIFVKAV